MIEIKSIYIKDIQPGDKVSEPFLVTEKNLAFSQKGSPYLNLRLKDKTGDVKVGIWENLASAGSEPTVNKVTKQLNVTAKFILHQRCG